MKILKGILLQFIGLGAFASAYASDQPEWIANPTSECSESYFCGVGIGSSEKKADADARSSIAKIFETKINSSFKMSLSEQDTKLSNNIKDTILEDVSGTLHNTEITKRFDREGTFYSFAVLDKEKSAQMLQEDMNTLDDKMEMLLGDDTSASSVKLEKLYEKRLSLNQQYIILTGHGLASKISYSDVFKNKKAKLNPQALFIVVKGTKDRNLDRVIKKTFKENGYSFTSKDNGGRSLVVSVSKQQMPFGISEMVKYEYVISIQVGFANGEVKDVFTESFEGTGLNEHQAFGEALKEMEKYLNENFETLDL